jgi:multidrug efflux pump subunit AcrA (membrane-fusion protein)
LVSVAEGDQVETGRVLVVVDNTQKETAGSNGTQAGKPS